MATAEEEVHNVNQWLAKMEKDPEWLEVENRPWANDYCRYTHSLCKGYDFVHHDPKIKLRFFWSEKQQKLVGSIHWDNRTEGPPGGAHGATVMFVFDEVLAYPVWRTGVAAFTANVNINLRKMIPFNTAARFEARVARSEGRKRFVEGIITNSDASAKYADATGLWIVSTGIGTSMQVWPEVVEADIARMQRGDRVLTGPFQISAATPSPRMDLFKGPVEAPDVDQKLPFQPELYKGETTSKFADAVPTPHTFPRLYTRHEQPDPRANLRVEQSLAGPREFFERAKL